MHVLDQPGVLRGCTNYCLLWCARVDALWACAAVLQWGQLWDAGEQWWCSESSSDPGKVRMDAVRGFRGVQEEGLCFVGPRTTQERSLGPCVAWIKSR